MYDLLCLLLFISCCLDIKLRFSHNFSVMYNFSYCRYPVPFTAYFVAGSDAEFSVSPQAGELLPVGTNGTMIRVTFSPTIYGKNYLANLVVQVRYVFHVQIRPTHL